MLIEPHFFSVLITHAISLHTVCVCVCVSCFDCRPCWSHDVGEMPCGLKPDRGKKRNPIQFSVCNLNQIPMASFSLSNDLKTTCFFFLAAAAAAAVDRLRDWGRSRRITIRRLRVRSNGWAEMHSRIVPDRFTLQQQPTCSIQQLLLPAMCLTLARRHLYPKRP